MMGFSTEFATLALKETGNDQARAAEWLFAHAHEKDKLLASSKAAAAPAGAPAEATGSQFTDGAAKYEMFAIISHLGSNTSCGHYVCHKKKDGQWYFFNDSKVARSEAPPFDMGYMYFFRRSGKEHSA